MFAFLLYLSLCQESPLVLAADTMLDGRGGTKQNVILTVEDGRIDSIRIGEAPSEAMYIPGAVLVPGFVDAYSYAGVGSGAAEESRESVPTALLSGTVSLDDPAFARALREGVTSSYLAPDSLAVIAGRGTVVKNWGGTPSNLFASANSAARVVESAAALKLTLGSDPSWRNHMPYGQPDDVFTRRPTTRMGVTWVIRREFHKALQYRKARQAGETLSDPAMDILVAAIEGTISVRVQARRAHDVETALRLQREFGWQNLMIEEGTEAHLRSAMLVDAGVSVVLGPATDAAWRSMHDRPQVAELRMLVEPPIPHADHEDETVPGVTPLSGVALDVVLAAISPDQARGLLAGRTRESNHATPAAAALLAKEGVAFAFGSAEAHNSVTPAASIVDQARTAVRFGLDSSRALLACTSAAAALCGVGDRVGALEVNMDADLVLWSGDPLDSSSRPLLVVVDGRIALDQRSAK